MQPVAMRRAVFCVVCSLFMRIFAVSGCHAVCPYVRMSLMYCSYDL